MLKKFLAMCIALIPLYSNIGFCKEALVWKITKKNFAFPKVAGFKKTKIIPDYKNSASRFGRLYANGTNFDVSGLCQDKGGVAFLASRKSKWNYVEDTVDKWRMEVFCADNPGLILLDKK